MTRVVAGDFRGRRLKTLPGVGTRPTAERAREGLFGWLGTRVVGASILDLFAGTGTVGIEALSRGAAHVTFVERAAAATAVLRRNLKDLGLLGPARVLTLDARGGLRRLGRQGIRFDLIFADPPYASDWTRRLANDLRVVDVLAPTGILVVERARAAGASSGGEILKLKGSRTYGGTTFDWYEPAGEASE